MAGAGAAFATLNISMNCGILVTASFRSLESGLRHPDLGGALRDARIPTKFRHIIAADAFGLVAAITSARAGFPRRRECPSRRNGGIRRSPSRYTCKSDKCSVKSGNL